jgi:hypothetical protein
LVTEVMVVAKQTQLQKWAVGALLFGGFWLCFFLDLTGLEAHQWLGVALGALAAYHLIVHWAWVKAVSQRFLARTSGQARLYYLLDAVTAFGLVLILVSGLVISTWLNLPLANYLVWKDLHVVFSSVTLLAVVVKLATHWRWLVRSTRQQARSWRPSRGGRPTVQPAAVLVTRRDFLSLAGVLGASSVAALANVWDFAAPAQTTVAQAAPVATAMATPKAVATPATVAQAQVAVSPVTVAQTQGGRGRGRRQDAPAVAQTSSATAGSTGIASSPSDSSASSPIDSSAGSPAEDLATTAAVTTACVVRCDQHCSYPGKCRRYVDKNGNGLCDLGECL